MVNHPHVKSFLFAATDGRLHELFLPTLVNECIDDLGEFELCIGGVLGKGVSDAYKMSLVASNTLTDTISFKPDATAPGFVTGPSLPDDFFIASATDKNPYPLPASAFRFPVMISKTKGTKIHCGPTHKPAVAQSLLDYHQTAAMNDYFELEMVKKPNLQIIVELDEETTVFLRSQPPAPLPTPP